MSDETTIHVRISPDLHQALVAEQRAQKFEVPLSTIIRGILTNTLLPKKRGKK